MPNLNGGLDSAYVNQKTRQKQPRKINLVCGYVLKQTKQSLPVKKKRKLIKP